MPGQAANGHVDEHVHSFEESFYVLDGAPVLYLDGRGVRLAPGACGVVPVGVAHAWSTEGGSRWVSMAAPRTRSSAEPPDTFFVGGAPDGEIVPLDVRDPRNRNLFLLTPGEMDLDRLKQGAAVAAPTVSASMATAALAYSGIVVKMLVDKRLDAQLSTMFMVGYAPGAVAHPHDHPFEEAYYMLEGEVEAVADGERQRCAPAMSSGPGSARCTPSTRPGASASSGWSVGPRGRPTAHSYRFERDWDYLRERL